MSKIRTFDSGATRDSDICQVTGLPKPDYHRFLDVGVLKYFCEEYMLPHRKQSDGAMREPDNWKKGFGLPVLMASKSRHYFETWSLFDSFPSDPDEQAFWTEHMLQSLSAELFNTMAMMREILQGRNV